MSRSQRCEPMKPAPPVTRILLVMLGLADQGELEEEAYGARMATKLPHYVVWDLISIRCSALASAEMTAINCLRANHFDAFSRSFAGAEPTAPTTTMPSIKASKATVSTVFAAMGPSATMMS